MSPPGQKAPHGSPKSSATPLKRARPQRPETLAQGREAADAAGLLPERRPRPKSLSRVCGLQAGSSCNDPTCFFVAMLMFGGAQL